MFLAQVDKYSHHFKVSRIHPYLIEPLLELLAELTQKQFFKIRGRVQHKATKVYATSNYGYKEFRFHINVYRRFVELLACRHMDINSEVQFKVIEHEIYTPPTITSLKMPDSVVLRDYQEEASEYVMEEGVSKLITIYTGGGKTFTILKTAELMQVRVLIVVLGRYMEKWVEDVTDAYGKDIDLAVVKGSNDLNKLLQNASVMKTAPDVTIISTTTLQNYIKQWEQATDNERENLIDPTDMHEVLGIGLRVIDEAHQHFHANFKLDLYTHCPKTAYLTATLESNDSFLLKMYWLMWPGNIRSKRLKPPAYDHTYALHYQHFNPERVRHMGTQGYSHVMYEQSIWKHVPSRLVYLEMIGDVVEKAFLPKYKPGRKMLIFCSLVETCVAVSEYLLRRFKDQNWQISKFVAGDPKTLIDTNDITVSTLGKSGTALDIYGLITCLMTVALSEPKANIQAKGRLRDIKVKPEFSDITPEFYFFVADDLDKPRQYADEKKRLFAERTLQYRDEYILRTVGEPTRYAFPRGIPAYLKEDEKS